MSLSVSVVDLFLLIDIEFDRSGFLFESVSDGDDAEFPVFIIFFLSFDIADEDINGVFFFRFVINNELVISSSDVSESDVLDERIADDFALLRIIVFRRGAAG